MAARRAAPPMRAAPSAARAKPNQPRSYAEDAASYWTTERLEWLTNGKADLHPFSPEKPGAAVLLRTMGLLDGKGAMTEAGLKKYQQVTSLFLTLEQALGGSLQQETTRPLQFVDLCAGQGHLALLLAHVCGLCLRIQWGPSGLSISSPRLSGQPTPVEAASTDPRGGCRWNAACERKTAC